MLKEFQFLFKTTYCFKHHEDKSDGQSFCHRPDVYTKDYEQQYSKFSIFISYLEMQFIP